MPVTFTTVKMPTSLKPGTNGRLGPCDLKEAFFPGLGHQSMYVTAARAWAVLALKVFQDTGVTITATPGGVYRSFEAQENAFDIRMSPFYNPLTCTTTTRTYLSKKYWLKRGYAPVAAPEWFDKALGVWRGGSNHGWGLAIDTAIWNGRKAVAITSNLAVWRSLARWAPQLGFSWEGVNVPGNWEPGMPAPAGFEPWHIRYVLGDVVPQLVKDTEAWFAAQA